MAKHWNGGTARPIVHTLEVHILVKKNCNEKKCPFFLDNLKNIYQILVGKIGICRRTECTEAPFCEAFEEIYFT